MIVSDLELFRIDLPSGFAPVRSLLIRLAADNGCDGWGETSSNWRGGELAARRKSLLSVLAGREACDVESILALDALGDPALACGVEMALWDLIARSVKLPLCQLMGGGYRRNVPMSVRLPEGGAEITAERARTLSAQAISSQVISSTGALEADLKLVAAVREACGERLQLRFDARGRYELQGAVALCSRLEPDSVQYVFDPLERGRWEHATAIRARARVALGAFDGIHDPADILRLDRLGVVSCVMVDPRRVGGIARARQCAAVADAAGLAATLCSEGTTGLALAASLQLAAATPGFGGGHECSYPMLHDDILCERLRVVDGMLAVPSASGLGVDVDRDKLERYQATD